MQENYTWGFPEVGEWDAEEVWKTARDTTWTGDRCHHLADLFSIILCIFVVHYEYGFNNWYRVASKINTMPWEMCLLCWCLW